MGGTEWAKTKLRVANKIEKIADDLIDLYAAREMQKGHAFMHDDQYQLDFENEFPYTETSDQLRSIEEVKADMEKEKPMDRLLVGDVGFGKTEVALRAAFKAVEDGKQVAFLVPTTILAQQHFQTIKERFEKFPVKVSMLSRFSSSKETKKIINDLNDHNIDIIVGTHRLLSKDVSFADLGLLIIDEEQRFGVKHKEKIKQLKNNVDVLTLTATPIPRTLNMSMIGVRDLSVIETPPANRYPIQTYVMEYNFNVLKQSIMREMSRGGQVFYLHNRVHDIESVVDNIKQIDIEYVKTVIFSNIENIATGITSDMPNRIISFIKGMFSGLGTLVIGLVIGFYLLISFDNTENLLSFLPKKSQKGTRDLLTAIDSSLRGFVQGAILDCSLIFVISSLAFALVGLRAPLLFGLFCGLTNIIPYAGPYIGGAPAVIVGFSQSPTIGIFTLLSIVLIQFVEGNFLQSLILSKTTKLHPVTIIIGLLIFGHFWGILGMAVSTPIISALKTLLLFLDERYDILKFN